MDPLLVPRLSATRGMARNDVRAGPLGFWRSLGDSNPCFRRERATSWATRRREPWRQGGGDKPEWPAVQAGAADQGKMSARLQRSLCNGPVGLSDMPG